jgi:hypothetical protein
MKRKPKYRIRQVLACPGRFHLHPLVFMVGRITWDEEWKDWRYHQQDEDISALERRLRPLTQREIGPQRKTKAGKQ